MFIVKEKNIYVDLYDMSTLKKSHTGSQGWRSKRSSIKMSQCRNGPCPKSLLLCNYLIIIRYVKRHFAYKIRDLFHLDVSNYSNFGDMDRERLPAKICEFVETFLPVDLYLSLT